MENTKDNKRRFRNYAFIEGYLRECYLKEGVSQSGKPYISGDVIVSVTQFNAQRVHVFASATKANGQENKAYKSLQAFLGDKVTTIAAYAKAAGGQEVDLEYLPNNLWEAATKAATKVWLSGSLEEYASIAVDDKGGEHETSVFSFRASNGSIRRDNDSRQFTPRSTLELDGSILAIRPEMVKEGTGEDADYQESGRECIDYLYIDYKGIGHKFQLYAGTDKIKLPDGTSDSIAGYVKDSYEVGQTAKFNLAIVNLAEKKTLEPKQLSWGQTSEPTVVTRFVHELRIIGGRSMTGITEDDADFITREEVTDAAAKRRVAAKENWEQAQARKNRSAPAKQEPAKGFTQEGFGQVSTDAPAAEAFEVPNFKDF